MIPLGMHPPWPKLEGDRPVAGLTRERRDLPSHQTPLPSHSLNDSIPDSILSRSDRADKIRKLSSSLLSDRKLTLLPLTLLGTRVVTMIDPCATEG